VPLSFVWNGERLLMATSAKSATGRNLLENGRACAAVGATRDLVIVVGTVSPVTPHDQSLPRLSAERLFAERMGFGPSDVGEEGTLFVLTPREIQTWVDHADTDRWVMRDGRWLV
jgi:Pyridoxamine 5'-phosphate oxidase